MHDTVARLAAAQDGLVGASQLASLVPDASQRRRLVRRGWLRPAAPRVYRVAGAPETHRFHLRLGLLSLGPRSWVSYEAAAALHGLDRSDHDAIEFTVPHGARRVRLPYRVHTTAMFRSTDFVSVDGFRALSATRTVFDLAHARRGQRRVEAAIDSAVRLGLSSPTALAERLETLRGSGRWGCRLVERLLDDAGGHTMLERRFLELVRDAGLPRPEVQPVIRDGERHVARVDFLFRAARLVVEVTGKLGHTTPMERARDAQRRNELQDLGFRVIEYTWEDVNQRPLAVIRTLRTRLAA